MSAQDKEVLFNGEVSFFLISLLEHKTEVDYTIHMQIFRYMVYIWERYERDCEKREKGCTRRKEFQYPPIIPIVYYEGKRKWTAPEQFKEKIVFGEQFEKYLPNFSYYIVPVHQYSNEMLMSHGDEISLVMLINRMQTADDISAFRNLPAEKIDAILKNTPDYLLDIISKVLRAFLQKENVPEHEAEELAGRVKERKMGELFANMDKMDIQAERAKTSQALEKGIQELIKSCQKLGASKEYIIKELQNAYDLYEEDAKEKVENYWISLI